MNFIKMAAIYLYQCLVAMSFYSMIRGNDIIYSSDETNSPSTYIGTVANNTNLKELAGQENFENTAPVIVVNLLSGNNVAHITEYANKGTVVAHIAVQDDDTGDNGNVYCTMKSDFFELMLLGNKEYLVFVKENLDHENVAKHHETVICQDNGKPSYIASSNFTVQIDDENDNAPTFSSIQYSETIFENNERGDVIVQVFAIDRDTGKNAEIRYFLENSENSKFMVDSVTGILRAAVELDREVTPVVYTKIYAIDQGSPALTGTATIKVTVLDLNDNAPVFEQEVFKMEVFENKPNGVEIGQLVAFDNDAGDNGKIIYGLPPGTPIDLPFLVLPTGQIITNKVLHREAQPSYGFYVIAYDLGYPSRTSTASVIVDVKETNDPQP